MSRPKSTARLEDPPPIKVIGRGLGERSKNAIKLANRYPGRWVRVGEYGTPGSARSKANWLKKYGYETTTRGRVVYMISKVEPDQP